MRQAYQHIFFVLVETGESLKLQQQELIVFIFTQNENFEKLKWKWIKKWKISNGTHSNISFL